MLWGLPNKTNLLEYKLTYNPLRAVICVENKKNLFFLSVNERKHMYRLRNNSKKCSVVNGHFSPNPNESDIDFFRKTSEKT